MGGTGRNWAAAFSDLSIRAFRAVILYVGPARSRAAAGLSTAVAAADNELGHSGSKTSRLCQKMCSKNSGSSLVGSYSISGLSSKSDSQLHISSHSFTSRQKLTDSQLFLRLAIQEGAKALVVTLITTNTQQQQCFELSTSINLTSQEYIDVHCETVQLLR